MAAFVCYAIGYKVGSLDVTDKMQKAAVESGAGMYNAKTGVFEFVKVEAK